jgi:hypothetical protein
MVGSSPGRPERERGFWAIGVDSAAAVSFPRGRKDRVRPEFQLLMDTVIVIAVVCFFAGAGAASRWLPDLAPGPVGGLAFFAVCGLFGAALAALGVNVDYLVRTLEGSGPGDLRADEVASARQRHARGCWFDRVPAGAAAARRA